MNVSLVKVRGELISERLSRASRAVPLPTGCLTQPAPGPGGAAREHSAGSYGRGEEVACASMANFKLIAPPVKLRTW